MDKFKWLFLRFLTDKRGFADNQGSGDSGSGDDPVGDDKGGDGSSSDEKLVPQSQVDRIVQDRLARERAKYSDYEDLSKKVQEYEKQQEQMSQQELEKKQEYEKLKENWQQKEQEYQQKLNETRQQVEGERINNTLNQEILKKNAYPEAAQLLRSMAKYNEDGTVTIKGKDANGMETDLPVDKGVEQFLNERPYLVKGSGQGGGGTSGSSSEGGESEGEDLSKQLQDAMAVDDRKKIVEIKKKIKQKHANMGASTII